MNLKNSLKRIELLDTRLRSWTKIRLILVSARRKDRRDIFLSSSFLSPQCCKATGQRRRMRRARSIIDPFSPSALLTPEGSAARGENRHMLPL